MSETKYESKISSAPCSAQQIYRVLRKLENLERVRDLIPKDKIQEMEIEPDRVRMKVDGFVPAQFNQVKGQPFVVAELVENFTQLLNK